MASKKQNRMLLKQEVVAPPAADRAPTRLVSKPGKADGLVEAETMGKRQEAVRTSAGPGPGTPDNLPPDCCCRGVRVTLDNNSMWNEFFRCKTEMIVTKQGSRMFPYCRFHISGLNPSRKYSLIMDVQPQDSCRYRWSGKSWQVAGRAEAHIKSPPFCHPESPSSGQHWMRKPVSFYKLKLTLDGSDQEGHAVLRPMHRYLPRLHVVQSDRAAEDVKLSGPGVITFTFPQTEFMAVTSYQSARFAQLKVDYNPFAKGLKEDASGTRGRTAKLNPLKDEGTAPGEQHPVKKSLKSLLANHKPRSSKTAETKPSGSEDKNPESRSPDDRLCSRPAQKLFSELIREAHVSLQRCSLEQLGLGGASCRPEAGNASGHTHTETSAKRQEAPATKIKNDKKQCLDSESSRGADWTDVCDVSADAGPTGHDPPSQRHAAADVNTKQHKRPAPLPLPALARFLKQHSTKCKKVQKEAEPPEPPALESRPRSPDGPRTEQSESKSRACPHPDVADLDSTAGPHSSLGDAPLTVPDSDHIPCPLRTRPPGPATSDTVLLVPNSPQTSAIVEALPTTEPPPLPSDSLLSEAECSSFVFESLSPTSSPEPLPPLPVSLALALNSTEADPVDAAPPKSPPQTDDAPSVFQWHTVLPPPEPYIDSSFVPFQSSSPPLPLASISPPSPSPSHPEPQAAAPSSPPPPDPVPPFQENEQSLPFPAELSPLQLPLSPSFSSLDGGGLSPTPSIAELVHFFSTDEDLAMAVEFTTTETAAVTCPPAPAAETQEQELEQPTPPPNKPRTRRKSRRQKLAKMDANADANADANMDASQTTDDSTYTSMRPNLEEVEEQLFISFTSKEALKLHIADSGEGTTPEGDTLRPADAAVSEELRICSLEETLLRDLKLMKHRQVIHPVLQEVGLKMNLLDPTLAIDLQYLGVHMPIPPPGASVEPLIQELPPAQGISVAFVSRTGKTTDVTRIKGWRDKFSPSEAPPILSSTRPEAGPSAESKRNLSAFCSDMLDEYLETEGKLIDQRAASFSQPAVEPPPYQLPTHSSSYVRTLDNVLKTHAVPSPTSDLITGFVPPSKRPRPSLKDTKTGRRGDRKQKVPTGPKQSRVRPQPEAGPTAPPPDQPAAPPPDQPAAPPPDQPAVPPPSEPVPPQRRRKLKPQTLSRSLSAPLPHSDHLAPLESDSELGPGDEPQRPPRPQMTRALLRQKDLEDGVVWEGQPPTTVTRERAAVALTALFTLKGFVSDNPTAPLQLGRSPAPPCLQAVCRLGCLCSSLSLVSRTSHCGRPSCMLGCSCLKQKVVLLKNLDGSDSSPSHQGTGRKRRRRRMKMAYVLKEADSVSQPAQRVRTLWNRDREDVDPEPVHIPEPVSMSRPMAVRGSCARVRSYRSRDRRPEAVSIKTKPVRLKSLKHRNLTLTEVRSSPPRELSPAHLSGEAEVCPPSPAPEPPPRPSKRLIILAECKWANDADRNHVLKRLCEAMAQDRLDAPFWIRKYLISPVSQTVDEDGPDRCIQYKIHISRPPVERERPGPQPGPSRQETPQQQEHLSQVVREAEPHASKEEAEPLEDWQREVEEGDIEEEEEPTLPPVHDGSSGNMKLQPKKKKRRRTKWAAAMALPFLTGISPAGFLSASRKQPGGTDHLVQVNGKLYPLAKIQLGRMGALHPANRLAAYLTGRVGAGSRTQPSPTSSSLSGPAPQTLGLRPSPQHTAPPSVPHPGPSTVDQSAAVSADQSGEASDGSKTRVITVRIHPRTGGAVQVTATPVASGGSVPSASVALPTLPPSTKAGPAPHMKIPTWSPAPLGQRLVLQPVQVSSGAQFYRAPDGKLVQLVPLSKLRPVQAPPTAPRPVQAPPTVPRPVQAPPIAPRPVQAPPTAPRPVQAPPTAPRPVQAPPTAPRPVQAPPTAPGPASCPSIPAASHPPSQKMACTLKLLPPSSDKEPIVISCPRLPPLPSRKVAPPAAPVNLRGAELLVRAVSADPVGPRGSSETTPPEPEPAYDPVDLDIVCVDDEDVETWDLTGTTSGETDNSSDEDVETMSENDGADDTARTEHRVLHNLLQRKQRLKMVQLFNNLKKEVGLKEKKTKIHTLKKAVQMIQDLKTTEAYLRERKMKLMKRREDILSSLVPGSTTESVVDPSPRTGSDIRAETHQVQTETGLRVHLDQDQAANQLSAAGGMASGPSTGETVDDDITFQSSNPPPAASAPPTTTPAQRVQVALAPPTVSHSAPVVRQRPRTVPNILSRSKASAPPSSNAGEASSIHALVPADLLSLVGAPLPGQPVLTLAAPMVLQAPPTPGVASVTLNIPRLTNQQLRLASPLMPRPPLASNLLQLVQPQVLTPSLLVSAGSESTNQSKDQGQASSQKDARPDSSPAQAPSSSPRPGCCDVRGEGGAESLTTLLDEIVFLNEQTAPAAPCEVNAEEGGANERGHVPNHRVLDPGEETTRNGSTDANTKGGVLAPPPLLQMKVGGSRMTDAVSGDGAARLEGGVAWRPMPRLVPLGLRGNLPT